MPPLVFTQQSELKEITDFERKEGERKNISTMLKTNKQKDQRNKKSFRMTYPVTKISLTSINAKAELKKNNNNKVTIMFSIDMLTLKECSSW